MKHAALFLILLQVGQCYSFPKKSKHSSIPYWVVQKENRLDYAVCQQMRGVFSKSHILKDRPAYSGLSKVPCPKQAFENCEILWGS